jgi:hypothetical protein
VRIAISGVHRTGKTTLAEALGTALPGHSVVSEPYYLLAEEGYEFSDPPTVEDFEHQLERAIELLQEPGRNRIFDRCPADFFGYLQTHDEAGRFDRQAWLPTVAEAMASLDLVVFCAIERPERIAVDPSERRWRRGVDEALREIIIGDRWEWGIPTVEVSGDQDARVRQVLAALDGRPS